MAYYPMHYRSIPRTSAVLSHHLLMAKWEGRDPGVLLHKWTLDDRARQYVIIAGDVSRLDTMRINHALVTALVGRWCQETHTFHLPVGKAIILLQNATTLLGLWIDCPPAIDHPMHDWDVTFTGYWAKHQMHVNLTGPIWDCSGSLQLWS